MDFGYPPDCSKPEAGVAQADEVAADVEPSRVFHVEAGGTVNVDDFVLELLHPGGTNHRVPEKRIA
jgi:hypothetical protein